MPKRPRAEMHASFVILSEQFPRAKIITIDRGDFENYR